MSGDLVICSSSLGHSLLREGSFWRGQKGTTNGVSPAICCSCMILKRRFLLLLIVPYKKLFSCFTIVFGGELRIRICRFKATVGKILVFSSELYRCALRLLALFFAHTRYRYILVRGTPTNSTLLAQHSPPSSPLPTFWCTAKRANSVMPTETYRHHTCTFHGLTHRRPYQTSVTLKHLSI